MFDNPRKVNALIFMVIGIILLNTGRLQAGMAGAPDLVIVGMSFLPVLGIIFLALGIYRFAAKEK